MDLETAKKRAKHWEKCAKKSNIEAANLRQQILFLLSIINTSPSIGEAMMTIEDSERFDEYLEVLNGE